MQRIFFLMAIALLSRGGAAAAQTPSAGWLAFPTVFTPNGDGNNDFFQAYGEGVETFHLRIYNRQGVLCYETTSWQEARNRGWDGKIGGQPAPAGVYVWTVEGTFDGGQPLQDKQGKKHGSFYLQP